MPMNEGLSPLTEKEIEILKEGGFDSTQLTEEQQISISAERKLKELINTGISVDEAASLLKVSRLEVEEYISERSLYAVSTDSGPILLEFQFSEEGLLPGITSVNRAFPEDIHPVAVNGFLSNPDPDLVIGDKSVSPLDWLKNGENPEPVINVAKSL